MRTLTIIWTYMRLGIATELEYRGNFLLQVLESAISLVVAVGGLAVVFGHTQSLGGWLPDQLLALVGIHLLVGGMINTFINPSMQRFMENVRLGTLDYALIKPADAQLLVSVQRVEVWKLFDVGLGVTVVGVATIRLGAEIGLLEAGAFAAALLCGGAIVYSFWLILATFSFWFVRVDNILVIFEDMYQAGRWPITIYPGWLRFSLTFVVPIAFAVTVPAQGLVGQLTTQTLLLAAGLALVVSLTARLFWRFGLRHYAGASA